MKDSGRRPFSVFPAGGVLQGAQTLIHLEAAAGMGDELSGQCRHGTEDQRPPQTAAPSQTQTTPGHPEEAEDPHGRNRYIVGTICPRNLRPACAPCSGSGLDVEKFMASKLLSRY